MAQLQAYEQYQPIDYDYVKQLPVDWRLLPNIAIFQERIERGHSNEELLSVTIGKGVIRQTEVDIKKDSSNEDKSKYKLIKVGDIAYNKMRMWQGALGYSDYQGISSPAYIILKPTRKINPRYFHYMFRSPFYTNYSKRFSYGIVDDQLSLRYTDFKRMYSIVPPLDTQNRIVEYLDKKNNEIDRFIRNKERLIYLLEISRKRKIFDAITKGINQGIGLKDSCIEWFGYVPKHWIVTRAKVISKVFVPDRNKPELNLEKNGIPWVTTEVIGEEVLDEETLSNYVSRKSFKEIENRALPKNSIVATCVGSFGISSFVTFECFINQQLQAYTELKINPYYLRYIIQSSEVYFNKFSTQTTLMYVNKKTFAELPVLCPPIDEQNQIIDFIKHEVSGINLAISKAQQEITAIKEYREALITDLVTGKRCLPPSIPK